MCRKKSDLPYILHPMEAAVVVGTMTDDQNVIAAAALHDVVEDAGITLEEIEERFGRKQKCRTVPSTEDRGCEEFYRCHQATRTDACINDGGHCEISTRIPAQRW